MIQQFYFWVYTPKKWKQGLTVISAHSHSSIIHKSQKMEGTHVINSVNKQNVYVYNGILALKRKEIFIYVTKWMNFEDVMLHEANQLQKVQILNDSAYKRYLR